MLAEGPLWSTAAAPRVLTGRCVVTPGVRVTCRACVEACPQEAIVLARGPAVVRERCDGCGICVSACANEVFRQARAEDATILRRAREAAADHGAVRYVCEKARPATRGEVGLRCAGRLTETLLVAPLIQGAQEVQVETAPCEPCERSPGGRHLRSVLSLSRNLCELAGVGGKRVREVQSFPAKLPGPALPRQGPGLGRRALLRSLTEPARAVLAWEVSEEVPEVTAGSSREVLLAALAQIDTPAACACLAPGGRFGLVAVGPECIGCNVCAHLCPTGAIRRQEHGDVVRLQVLDGLCTACGVCAAACGPRAIHVEKAIDIGRLRADEPRALVETRLQHCAGCGILYPGTTRVGFCPACLRRNLAPLVHGH